MLLLVDLRANHPKKAELEINTSESHLNQSSSVSGLMFCCSLVGSAIALRKGSK
jgi:hypothetical protein